MSTGPSSAVGDVPPLPVPQRRGVLEVDAFCVGCQYNLHGQTVTVDERLQLPVCRCPECGRFHAAGVGVSASGLWTRRLGTLLLVNWVLLVLALAAGAAFVDGMMSVGFLGAYSYSVPVAADGRVLEYKPSGAGGGNGYFYAGTQTPAKVYRSATKLEPIFPPPGTTLGEADPNVRPWEASARPTGPEPAAWLAVSSLVLGLLTGAACVTFLWHWRSPRYLWAVTVPGLAAAVVLAVVRTSDAFVLVRNEATGRVLGMTAVQCLGVLIGVAVGRPLARGVLRAIVPPKPRQAVAFLWQVDGKRMPT